MEPALKYKIRAAINEDFVGDFIFQPDELAIIYDEAARVLLISDEDMLFWELELIFVALVNVTKDWEAEEDTFYGFIYKKILGKENDVNASIYLKILNIIDSLARAKSVYLLASYRKKYYATICSHAFSPKLSIESFFDICWEIYCKDFNQQYGINDPAFELIADSLRNKFNYSDTSEDNFQIGSKVYSFRVGIKGLAIEQKTLLVELLDRTMFAIHKLFNNEPINQDKYLYLLINNWWKKKESMFGIPKERASAKRDYIATDYSQIKPKYIIEEGTVRLIAHSIRLLDHFDEEPVIEIKVNGESHSRYSMATRGSGILMATNPLEFDLKTFNFNEKIDPSIEITHCGQTIYQSKDNLHRDYILFKDGKEIISQEVFPGMYFLYCIDLCGLLRYPDDTHWINLNTYSLEAREGDVIQGINKSTFFFVEESNRDLYFYVKKHAGAKYRLGNEEYIIIDGDLYVDLFKKEKMNDYGVRYEEASFKLTDFDWEDIGDCRRYKLSVLSNVGQPTKITIFKYSDNSLVYGMNLIKFNDIQVKFDQNIYYGNNEKGKVRFITEKYDKETTFFVESQNEVVIPFNDGELVFNPPLLKWKIDNHDWHIGPLEPGVWFKEMSNSSLLEIEIPKEFSCVVGLSNNLPLEQVGNELKYKIGQTIHALAYGENNSNDILILFIKTNADKKYKISEIHLVESFTDDPLFVLPDKFKVSWQPESFIGERDAKFRLDVFEEGIKKETIYLSMKRDTLDFSKLNENIYCMTLTLEKPGFIKIDKELMKKNFFFGNEKNLKFKNKVLFFKSLKLFGKAIPEPIKPLYVDGITFMGTKEGFDIYSGSAFVLRNDSGKSYLQKSKINPIRIEMKNERSCYVGYAFNTNAEDLDEYEEFALGSGGRLIIADSSSNPDIQYIDYFIFEVISNV